MPTLADSPLRRVLPEDKPNRFDPFLVFHEQGPVCYRPREAVGFAEHPHRGFETVTYLIKGEQRHSDSFGHGGTLHPGDVQWLTAGRGILHAELPTPDLLRTGGTVHALQIWLNLPASRKLEKPRYQNLPADRLPTLGDRHRWLRVIAGSVGDVTSPIETGRPVLFVHACLTAGGDARFVIPSHATVVIYAQSGSVTVAGSQLAARHVAVLRDHSGELLLTSPEESFEGIVLAAQPLNEPFVSGGPFVMNTRQEIEAAYDDYIAGTFGADAGD